MNSSSWIPKDLVFCNLIGNRVALNKLSLSFHMSTQLYENWERLLFFRFAQTFLLTWPLCSATALAAFFCPPNHSILWRSGNSGVHMRMTLLGDPEHFWKPKGKRCDPLEGCIWGKNRHTAHAEGSCSLAALPPLTKDSPGCPGSPCSS